MTPLSTTHRTWALAALLWGCAASPTWAHDGEDHGTGPAPAPTVATAPRAVAQTDAFELVATLDGQTLTLTLDHFATNEPVANAQIELEAGPLKATATPVAPGVYTIQATSHLVAPGKYPLTLSVEAGDTADLLTTTLELPAPGNPASTHPANAFTTWTTRQALLAGAALFGCGLLGGTLLTRRRSQPPRT